MLGMGLHIKGLGEQVGGVSLCIDVLHLEMTLEGQLTHLEIAAINVPRPMA